MVLIGCLACLGSGITSLGFQRYLGSGTRSPQAASLLSPSWTYTLSCAFKKDDRIFVPCEQLFRAFCFRART